MTEVDPISTDICQNEIEKFESTDQNQNSVWEHEDLAQVRIKVLRGHEEGVNSCQFCLDGDRVVTASDDKSVKLWDVQTCQEVQSYEGHTMAVTCARVDKQGTRMISSGWDKKVHLWDLETGKILWTGTHGGVVTSCSFSHDGFYAVSGSDLDYSVKVWEVATGECIHNITGLHKSTITCCLFSPKDDRIITTSMDKTTKFWDILSQTNTISLEGHNNVISAAAYSKDERKLATVSWDKSINIWDISTGMYRSEGPKTLLKAHEGSVSSCQFSEDSTMLVSGGYDQSIVVWDVENCVQKLRLQGHTDWITGVDISTDQNWLLSCAKDKTVRLWNVEDSDNIPVVLENKKSIGLKVLKCNECGKPFSMAQVDLSYGVLTCVFCRLKTPDRQYSPSSQRPSLT